MPEPRVDKNVNYPSLEDVLKFLAETIEYFAGVKSVKALLKSPDVSEVRKHLKLATKAEAIIYQEMDIMRSSVLSKKDLAKATGIPYATFFRLLKKRNFTNENLRTICMLLIDPTLKEEFILVEKARKFIETQPEDCQDFLWIYLHSIYFEREYSPFYNMNLNIDLTNEDEVARVGKILNTKYSTAITNLIADLGPDAFAFLQNKRFKELKTIYENQVKR
jgi:hypothetical protein